MIRAGYFDSTLSLIGGRWLATLQRFTYLPCNTFPKLPAIIVVEDETAGGLKDMPFPKGYIATNKAHISPVNR